jgi:hypothetical protein
MGGDSLMFVIVEMVFGVHAETACTPRTGTLVNKTVQDFGCFPVSEATPNVGDISSI